MLELYPSALVNLTVAFLNPAFKSSNGISTYPLVISLIKLSPSTVMFTVPFALFEMFTFAIGVFG